MIPNLQHAFRGAIVGAVAYLALVLFIDFTLATNTLQPTPVPLSSVVRQVGFALLVGAVTGATFAYAIAGSSITARSYLRAGALAGTAFTLAGLALALLAGRVDSAWHWALLLTAGVICGMIWGLFAFITARRGRRGPRRYVSRRPL